MQKKKMYKKVILVIFLISLLGGCQSITRAEQPQTLLITQVYYHAYPNTQNEFIALTNPTSEVIDLNGLYLTDDPWKSQSAQAKIYLQNEILWPTATLIITQNATAYLQQTGQLPSYEYKGDSHQDVPNLKTYKAVTLSNTGGCVALKNSANETMDLVIYGTTDQTLPEWDGAPVPSSGSGVILLRNMENGIPVDTNTAADFAHPRIYKIGQSDMPLQTLSPAGSMTLFVSPDCSYDAISSELANATTSIDINMYEFTNPFLYQLLLTKLHQNVTVRVFMEGSPVGGIDEKERYILSSLAAQGAQIRCIISDTANHITARYPYNHAKYIILDNQTVIVESCNWAKTGVPKDPSYGNREWGIIIHDTDVASVFSSVFQGDWNPIFEDSRAFEDMNITIPSGFVPNLEIPHGPYTPTFQKTTLMTSYTITPLFSPDNSEQAILDAINAATTSIYIEQLYIYKNWTDTISPFLIHLINKSHQGVDIRVLLDYNPTYEDTIAALNDTKHYLETNGIHVKFMITTESPFVTLHNKGMIIDNHTVLISSINWNEQSVRKNREAGVLLQSQEAALYYASVFLSDWNLDAPKQHTSLDFSWVDLKYLILIALVIIITVIVIIRDWRKRKWI